MKKKSLKKIELKKTTISKFQNSKIYGGNAPTSGSLDDTSDNGFGDIGQTTQTATEHC